MTKEEAARIIKECKSKGFKNTFYTLNEYHTALDMAIKALEQETCEDMISRQAVLGKAIDYGSNTYLIPVNSVKALPPVTPKPKTGHWIKVHPLQADDEGAYMCSCCEVGDWDLKGTEKFCPNCGAKMIEPQESEET